MLDLLDQCINLTCEVSQTVKHHLEQARADHENQLQHLLRVGGRANQCLLWRGYTQIRILYLCVSSAAQAHEPLL
jgi:hypothetical protein